MYDPQIDQARKSRQGSNPRVDQIFVESQTKNPNTLSVYTECIQVNCRVNSLLETLMNNFVSWSNFIWSHLGLQMTLARKSRQKSTLELTNFQIGQNPKQITPLGSPWKIDNFSYKIC